MANYDFDKLNREIPIEDVLALHHIYPNSKGWYSLRSDDEEPSSRVDPQKRYGNTIHDFGTSNTFNPISLTMYLNNLDPKNKEDVVKASQILGEAFGIEPIKHQENDRRDSTFVSDREWQKLSIYPDAASKNMSFYPDKFGFERTQAYAEKYRISMSELRKQNTPDAKDVYQKIVRSKGVSYVMDLRNSYLSGLYNWYNLRKELNIEFKPEELTADANISNAFKELTLAQNILKKAIEGTDINFKPYSYNILSDYKKVVNGEISFEIGKESHYDIKCSAHQNQAKVFYCLVSLQEYYKLMDNGMDALRTAAFLKGDEVNVAFVSTDSSRMNYLVRALRGKELDTNKNRFSEYVTSEPQKDVANATVDSNTKEPTLDIG